MKRLDTAEGSPWFSAAVYGKSGAGKTSLAVTAPKPLILLSEQQALLPIKQAAKRLGVPTPPTLAMESLDDCRSVLRALRGPKDQPFRVFEYVRDGQATKKSLLYELPEWPETVVLDTVTDLCRLIVDEIREQSPQRMGKDGLPVDSERYWNVLGDRCQNLILGFRDAPVHKLYLCAEDDRMDGEGDERKRTLGPSLPMRKLPALLSGAGNLTGYAYRRETRDAGKVVRVTYGVMSAGPEFMLLKPCPPVRTVEVPDFGYWVRTVAGELLPTPPQPAPSAESLQSVEVAGAAESERGEAPALAAPPVAAPAPEAPEAPVVPPARPARAKRGEK